VFNLFLFEIKKIVEVVVVKMWGGVGGGGGAGGGGGGGGGGAVPRLCIVYPGICFQLIKKPRKILSQGNRKALG